MTPGSHDGERPILTDADLREELLRIFGRGDGGPDGPPSRRRRAAFIGTPAPGVDAVEISIGDDRVRFRVVHARCELSTRRALVEAGDDPLVLLVDFDGRLPLDITGRLVGGKVRLVSDEQRLMRKFGVRSVSPDVLGGPLGKILLAEPVDAGGFPGATLDLEGAWRVVLGRALAVPREIVLTEERIVAHAARADDGGELRAMVARHPALAPALNAYLRDRVGPVAALAVRAVRAGRGRDVAALAFVLDALVPATGLGGYAAAWLKITLSGLDAEIDSSISSQRPLLERWAALASGLWLQLNGELEGVRALADRWLAADADLAAAITSRPFLATSLAKAKQDLADALDRALAQGQTEAAPLGALMAAFRKLEQHRLRDRVEHAAQCERARMAVRLAGWLAEAGPAAPFVNAADAVATLAGQHAEEGGFVDLARARARGVKVDTLDAAIARVVETADAARDRRDEAFAEALTRWDRGRVRVLPIEDVLDRIAVPFLAAHPRRKLLVLLLDGLAWDDAVELVEDLEPQCVGPVRWQPERPVGKLLPPVVAALPTVTGVSRAALFAGKVPKAGEPLSTAADTERFANHKGLRDLLGESPRLLLKGEAEERPGHLSDAALRLLSSDARVVGLVVNTIDEQLKAGAGAHVPTTVEMIKALPDILAAAAQACRAILLVADHGHVSGARFGPPRPRVGDGGARFRELGPDESPADREIVVDGDRAWRSKKTRKLAMLVRETETYVASSHAGEHGGASLAEAVAPAMLIASDGVSAACDDAELELRRFPRPRWWSLDAEVYVPTTAAPSLSADAPPAAPPPSKRPKGVRPGQIAFEMPGIAAPAVAAPVSSGVGAAERIAARIRSSPLYTEAAAADRLDWDNHVIPAVQAVVDAGGTMSRARFADVRRILIGRLPSVLVKVRDRLNLGQHPVFVDDAESGLLRFDQALFDELFRS